MKMLKTITMAITLTILSSCSHYGYHNHGDHHQGGKDCQEKCEMKKEKCKDGKCDLKKEECKEKKEQCKDGKCEMKAKSCCSKNDKKA